MSEVYIVSAVRSPICQANPMGSLSRLSPVELTALILQEAVRRAAINPERIDDIVWGSMTPLGDQNAELARLAAMKAGFPEKTPTVTLERLCGASQRAIHFACQAVVSGDMDIVIAGGTGSISKWAAAPDGQTDCPPLLVALGIAAERMADQWQLSREALDDFSYRSHLLAKKAIQNGSFESQILSIQLPDHKIIHSDEGVPRLPNRQKLAKLKPIVKEDGVITAGNSSRVSDACAALVLASVKAVGVYNLIPIARVVARHVVGSDSDSILDSPIAVTRQVLKRAGLELSDMDIIELDEAFASIALAWAMELRPDMEKVNPNGGAIALGHPLGAASAVSMTRLVYELQQIQGQYGLQIMTIGNGMGSATIIERIQ